MQPDTPAGRLSSLVSRFCKLRTQIKEKLIPDESTIVLKILEMDHELEEWATQLPRDWNFTVSDISNGTEGMYERSYHVYPDFWRARVWNGYRCTRILLNEILWHYLDRHFSSTLNAVIDQATASTYRHRSCTVVDKLAGDICASVPFHLSDSRPGSVPAAIGFFLLWPLYVVGAVVDTPDARRLWAIERLYYIRQITGIAQAASLANVLKWAGAPSPSKRTVEWHSVGYRNVADENDEEHGSHEGWKEFIGTPGKYT